MRTMSNKCKNQTGWEMQNNKKKKKKKKKNMERLVLLLLFEGKKLNKK